MRESYRRQSSDSSLAFATPLKPTRVKCPGENNEASLAQYYGK